jgi:peptide/nickel transport system substrate-binding protein
MPKLDEVDFKFIQDPNTQVMEYQKGTVDLVQLDSALYPTFANNEELKKDMHSFSPYGLVFLTINTQKITNPKVREALSYAIDRKTICEDLLYGTATPAKTFIPKGILGYNESTPEYEYNPEKAKQLLAEANYPDGIDLVVQDNTKYPTYSKMLVAIQEQAKSAGIRITINQVDNAAWADMKRNGKMTMAISNWYVDYVDPDGMIYQTMSEKLTKQNSNFYDDPTFNDLLNTARATSDLGQREDMYKKADQILTRRDYAAIPICNETMFYLAKSYVKGFNVDSSYRYYFGNIDIQK